jgi:hypothetical protein
VKRGAPHAPLLEAIASLADTSARSAYALTAEDEERDDTPAALDAAWEEAPVMFNDAQPPAGPATALDQVQP